MPDNLNQITPYAISGAFAAVCGAISYGLKIEEGKPFRWREFSLHTAASAVCGLISYSCLTYLKLPPDLCGALSGVAGWMGTRLMRIAEILVEKKLGVEKDDLK